MKILLTIAAGLLASSFIQDTIPGIKSECTGITGHMSGSFYQQDKKQFRELANILNKDVYGYFNLKDKYAAEESGKAYENTEDYRNKLAEIEKSMNQILSSTYYIEYQPVYNDVSSIPLKYDPTAKSFSILNEFDLNNFYDEPGYLQLDQTVFRYPPGINVKEQNASSACIALINETISFTVEDQVVASKIEENKDNLRLLFVFKLKGTVPVRPGTGRLTPADCCLLGDLKQILVFNSVTSEIYSVYKP